MKDEMDTKTGDLLAVPAAPASPAARRQAAYAERQRASGRTQRNFWLTGAEYEAMTDLLQMLRKQQ